MTDTPPGSPGCFVDLQYNGCWSQERAAPIDFSSEKTAAGDIVAALRASFRRGTISCPTVITMPRAGMLRNLKKIADALDELGIKGNWIHCEGPFFSGKEGARGAHPREHIVPAADIGLLRDMIEASRNKIAMLTVGADIRNITELIRFAAQNKIAVSLGHQEPSLAELSAAVDAGATMITHCGNGAPKMVERHGFFIKQMALSGLKIGIIADGVHLGGDGLFEKLAFMARGPRGIYTVSDRSPLGGAPAGDVWHDLWGARVRVAEIETAGAREFIIIGENGYFAGAYADMLSCMNRLAHLAAAWKEAGEDHPHLQIGENELWQVGAINPCRFLGKDPSDFASVRELVNQVHYDADRKRFVLEDPSKV